MSATPIICATDPLLQVYIYRSSARAAVWYAYDGGPEQSTPYQTADMPADDQQAADQVLDWIQQSYGA
jgi:hypothetical protein